MRFVFKLIGWLLALLALALVAAGAVAWVYANRAVPETSGDFRVQSPTVSPRAAIRVERDGHGIPTIKAESLEDLAWGLGWAHAQDRLWQLETHRRVGQGRLAEAFGPAALESDRFLRALGVRRAAERQWAAASDETKAVLNAYAAGINAWIAEGMKVRPPEFVVLGLQPEPWTPVDTMAWQIMMAWDLGSNWNTEVLRMRAALRLSTAQLEELLPPVPGTRRPVTADFAALYREWGVASAGAPLLSRAPIEAPVTAVAPDMTTSLGAAWAAEPGIEGLGSNGWVVSGARSATGAPLLASDPHLKLSTPALWYLARLESPHLKVAGGTIPGLPLVVLGQNEHVAWGWTTTGLDAQDLYLERLKPDDANQVQTPDGWQALQTFEEVIRVKGQPDVSITVRESRHGPVISDAGTLNDLLGIASAGGKPAYALALRWTALDADSRSMDAALAFARARTVDDYVKTAEGFVAPMQNMIVADHLGHIAMVSAGRVPVRRAENDLHGMVPAPGWDARYDWLPPLEPQATPRTFNPSNGLIANANQRVHGDEYPHLITHDWTPPWRHQRALERLAGQEKHTLASFAAIQADEVSLSARAWLPWAKQALPAHALSDTARQLMAHFGGQMAADQPAPLLLWAFQRQLVMGLFADDLGQPLLDRALATQSLRDGALGALARNDAAPDQAKWCDDRNTPTVTESCQFQINAAMTRALDELQARFGKDPSRWRWGDAHVARAEHRPFSRVPPLNLLFELRTPSGGDTDTLNVGRVALRADRTTGELYLNEHGPSLRGLYDLRDRTQSRIIMSTGQSGIPWSPHFRDLLAPWVGVRSVSLWADGPAVSVQAVAGRAAP